MSAKTNRQLAGWRQDENGADDARSAASIAEMDADVKTDSNALLDAALSYAARGWRVLPCAPGGKEPLTWLVSHGARDATTDMATIRSWWQRAPDANVGLASDPLVFVDVDAKGDRDGRESWRDLVADLGKEIEQTVIVETPSGGLHFYYAGVAKNGTDVYAPGIELRAQNQYVVAPPSRRADGEYTFALDHSPDDIAVAPLPPALSSALTRQRERITLAKSDGWLLDALRGGLRAGELRNNTATRIAGLLRQRGFERDAILELLRGWNLRNVEPLPDSELETVARSCARYSADAVRDVHFTTARELLAREFAPVNWIVADLLPAGTFALLIARAKVGKSWLCLQLADAMARGGGEFLAKRVAPGRALVFALEDADRYLQERLRLQSCIASDDIIIADAIPALDADGIEFLRDAIARYEPDLLIVDTFASAKSGKLDENDAGQVAAVMNGLRYLAHDSGVAVLLTHHSTKMALGDVILDARGSSAVGAAVDVAWGIYLDSDSARGVFRCTGRVIRRDEFNVRLDPETLRWQLIGENLSAAEEEVLDCLVAFGEADAGAIAKELDKNRTYVRETLQRLVGKCKATRVTTKTAAGSNKIIYMPYIKGPSEATVATVATVPTVPTVESTVEGTVGSVGSVGAPVADESTECPEKWQGADGRWYIHV